MDAAVCFPIASSARFLVGALAEIRYFTCSLFIGGPVGRVSPGAKGLVIGAATDRTFGTPDSVRFVENMCR